MGKNGGIEIVKPGHEAPVQLQITSAGRVYQVTPDGSQWEVRMHMMSDFSKIAPGAPKGEEIIGEVIVRSYNGGLAPLMAMAKESAETTERLVAKVMHEMKKAAAQQNGGVEIVTELPRDLKATK